MLQRTSYCLTVAGMVLAYGLCCVRSEDTGPVVDGTSAIVTTAPTESPSEIRIVSLDEWVLYIRRDGSGRWGAGNDPIVPLSAGTFDFDATYQDLSRNLIFTDEPFLTATHRLAPCAAVAFRFRSGNANGGYSQDFKLIRTLFERAMAVKTYPEAAEALVDRPPWPIDKDDRRRP